MEQKVLHRQPVVPPECEALPQELIARLASASASLVDIVPIEPSQVVSAPASVVAPLRHRLSDAYLARNGHSDTPIRAIAEQTALDAVGVTLRSADQTTFRHTLAIANAQTTDGKGGWRTNPVGTAPDPYGNSIVFPPQASVDRQIDRIHALLERDDVPAVFRAAMALALLTNCHPFRDGNGRVARMIFNHALRLGGMRDTVYVPFSELAGRSDGGYLIALRQGELHGQWEPFLEFVMTLLEVHRRIASLRAGATDVA